MANAKIAERPAAINNWQARQLLGLMDKFYSDPANQAAFEKWMANKNKEARP